MLAAKIEQRSLFTLDLVDHHGDNVTVVTDDKTGEVSRHHRKGRRRQRHQFPGHAQSAAAKIAAPTCAGVLGKQDVELEAGLAFGRAFRSTASLAWANRSRLPSAARS